MNTIILDKKKHSHLNVIAEHGKDPSEYVNSVPVIADELASLAIEFPVCLIKNETNSNFAMHALLGFEKAENLFIANEQWRSHYIPVHFRRQPFMVGLTKTNEQDASSETPNSETPRPENAVLTLDIDSPRVSETHGEPLFEADGSMTPYLKSMSQLVFSLVPAMQRNEAFIQALIDAELIEAVSINVNLGNEKQQNIEGIYTVNKEKLAALSGQQLEDFHQKGYLQACYLLQASMGNIQKLIHYKQTNSL